MCCSVAQHVCGAVGARIEPHARTTDLDAGLAAEVADPLWFLLRQLQLGELTGDDGGAPVAIDLSASYMVGDRWRDVEAGRRAGCRTIFIDRGYSERRPDPPADHDAADLTDAAAWILSDPERRTNSS